MPANRNPALGAGGRQRPFRDFEGPPVSVLCPVASEPVKDCPQMTQRRLVTQLGHEARRRRRAMPESDEKGSARNFLRGRSDFRDRAEGAPCSWASLARRIDRMGHLDRAEASCSQHLMCAHTRTSAEVITQMRNPPFPGQAIFFMVCCALPFQVLSGLLLQRKTISPSSHPPSAPASTPGRLATKGDDLHPKFAGRSTQARNRDTSLGRPAHGLYVGVPAPVGSAATR